MMRYPEAEWVGTEGEPFYLDRQIMYGGRLICGEAVVVCHHHTAGGWAGSLATLRSPRAPSSHFLLGKLGQVAQLVDTKDAAWTQGVSPRSSGKRHWVNGYPNENLLCVGIEIENSGSEDYPPAQIEALQKLVQWLYDVHQIPPTRNYQIGHYELDARKSDPNLAHWRWNWVIRNLWRDLELEQAGRGADRTQGKEATRVANTYRDSVIDFSGSVERLRDAVEDGADLLPIATEVLAAADRLQDTRGRERLDQRLTVANAHW